MNKLEDLIQQKEALEKQINEIETTKSIIKSISKMTNIESNSPSTNKLELKSLKIEIFTVGETWEKVFIPYNSDIVDIMQETYSKIETLMKTRLDELEEV